MMTQIAKGPAFRILGKRLSTERSPETGDINHVSHGVNVNYTASSDTLVLSGSKGRYGDSAPLHTKVGSDGVSVLVSASEDFGSHVALQLSGGLGDAAAFLNDSNSVSGITYRLSNDTLSLERDHGKPDQSILDKLSNQNVTKRSIDTFRGEERPGRPGPGFQGEWQNTAYAKDNIRSQEWLVFPATSA